MLSIYIYLLCTKSPLKGLSSEIYVAESGINRKPLLKSEALVDFAHPLSCERPFKCWRNLTQDLGCDKRISNYCTYLW